MKFKLPKIHLLIKPDREDTHKAVNHIFVKSGVAVAFSGTMSVCVDLREYVKRELEIDSTDEIESLDVLLGWMEGKAFTVEFWAELTKTNYVSLGNDGFVIEQVSYEKNLIYEVPLIDSGDINSKFLALKDSLQRPASTVDRICIDTPVLTLINKMFGQELRDADFLLDFSGKSGFIMFTGRRKEYIFGVIQPNYDGANEIHSFSNVTTFAETL